MDLREACSVAKLRPWCLVALVALVAACAGDDEASYEPPPLGTPRVATPVRLTAENVAAFLDYASGSTDRDELVAELEAARGDEAVSAALVTELERAWRVAGGEHEIVTAGGVGRVGIVLSVMRHLPAESFLEPLLARVDAPVVDDSSGLLLVEELQGQAAASAACVATNEALDALRAREAHPSAVVRWAIAEQLHSPVCSFFR